MPGEIPLEEQMELVNLVWGAPEADILTVGEVLKHMGERFPEIMGFTRCDACGELTTHAGISAWSGYWR
jgi:formylmethanofuran dehydrogenase subunit E